MCKSVGILFLMFFVAGSSLACDSIRIAQCQQTFMSDLGIHEGTQQEMSVLNSLQSEDRINLVCTSYDSFTRCFNRFVVSCEDGSLLKRMLTYLNSMYAYICDTGRADMIRYSDCWNTGNVQNETIQCQSGLIQYQGGIQNLCTTLDNTLTCMGDVVYRHCGVKSATAYTHILSYTYLMAFSTQRSCEQVKHTFGTVGNNPYENGRVPSKASNSKPVNSAYVMCIAMVFLLSLQSINLLN